MQKPSISDTGHRSPSPIEEDRELRRAVLHHLLSLHPIHLTTDEVVRELGADPADFGEKDAIERALRDLERGGLLLRQGAFVFPGRSTFLFAELADDL